MSAYSPGDPKPLTSYAAITTAFAAAVAGYEAQRRRRGWELPERVPAGDLALMAAATYKLSRLAAKDRVTSFARAPFTRFTGEAGPSEVSEVPRGAGLRRALGELAVCPYCIAHWVAPALLASYIPHARSTRIVASVFAVMAASDFLSQGWVTLQEHE